MSEESRDGGVKVERVRRKVESHEEALDHHDRRISRNENWRLQAQGALKIIALVLGGGGLALLLNAALNLF